MPSLLDQFEQKRKLLEQIRELETALSEEVAHGKVQAEEIELLQAENAVLRASLISGLARSTVHTSVTF